MASPGGYSDVSSGRTSSGPRSSSSSDLQAPTENKRKRQAISSCVTSSGMSSGPGGGSEDFSDLQALMEQRRKRRKESNRESARRSRMRRQLHLDGLASQAATLRAENYKMLVMLEQATVGYLTLESENSVLRTQTVELESRLKSLNEIIKCVDVCTNLDAFGTDGLNGTWNLGHMSMMPPLMASGDLYECF